MRYGLVGECVILWQFPYPVGESISRENNKNAVMLETSLSCRARPSHCMDAFGMPVGGGSECHSQESSLNVVHAARGQSSFCQGKMLLSCKAVLERKVLIPGAQQSTTKRKTRHDEIPNRLSQSGVY